ncbi:MAG: alpha/beta fold hydrolase [Candidatus Lokiarchaeota archaeon]|nr:alpha/beta fold hydrolase [Candidatus Lokiarchaeota archaeon]
MDEADREPTYLSGFDPVPSAVKERLWEPGLPFYLKSPGNPRAIVVCLHGFGATPFETRPVADACVGAGIDAVAPLLPGHGYSQESDQKREIVKMTRDGLIDAARREVARARERYGAVFAYGQSMGGAIALAIAGEGLVDACATTAPALKLPAGAGFNMALVALSFNKLSFYIKKRPKPRAFVNYSYSHHNSLAGAQMQRISLHARSMLRSIACPVHVAHSRNDSTIDPVVVEWVRSRATGPVEVAWFDKSDHTMPLDVQGGEVSASIAAFFTRNLP